MLSVASWGKVYKITYIFPKGTQLKIATKTYKLNDTISRDNPDFTKTIKLKKSKKNKNFSFTIRDVDTNKNFTYSTQYSKVKNRSFWAFLTDSFNNYCKNNGAMTKGDDDNELCGNLVMKDTETTDTLKSLDVIDQYHIKNIEYKRDTTVLLTDSVDIKIDFPKNKEFYLIYKLKNGKKIEKKLSVINDYVKIKRIDCEGLSNKCYPKGIDAVLLVRNVKLTSDNERSYNIRLIPLY